LLTSTLGAFAPIWVLTGLGYLLKRFDVLGERADAVLTRLAFNVAMPAVLFSTLIDTPFSALVNPGFLAFVVGTVLTGLLVATLAWWPFRRRAAERVVTGMAACYVNAGNLGIPVALQVLGDSSFIVAVLLFQSLLMMPALLTMLESDQAGGRDGRWRAVLLLPVRNPVIAASSLGVLVGTSGQHLPAVLLEPIHTLGDAGVATALLVLGMSLCTRPGRSTAGSTVAEIPARVHAETPGAMPAPGRRWELATVVTAKVLVQPMIALGAGILLQLPARLLLAAVVCSALPTAQNIFIATSRYAVDVRFTRNCVVATTLASMVTLSVIAMVLGSAGP
jgi:malonate transporter